MRYRVNLHILLRGHADELQDASLIEDCLENARRIINGEAESRPLDPSLLLKVEKMCLDHRDVLNYINQNSNVYQFGKNLV